MRFPFRAGGGGVCVCPFLFSSVSPSHTLSRGNNFRMTFQTIKPATEKMNGEAFLKRQNVLHTTWKQHSNHIFRVLDDMSPQRFLWEQQNCPWKKAFMRHLYFTSKGFISQGFSQSSRTTAYDSVFLRTKCKRSLYYKSTWILRVAFRNLNVTYRPVFCIIIEVALSLV